MLVASNSSGRASGCEAGSADPKVYFTEVYRAFSEAGQAAGEIVERYFGLGGFTLCLQFAGPALISPITTALAHLAIDPVASPSLTISLWDSASTRVRIPPFPWRPENYLEYGLVDGFCTERIKTICQSALQLIDLDLNRAVYWVPDASQMPYHHSTTPLRTIFHWWLSEQRRFIIHAAAVGLPEGGVLITGRGGAGKSTTALASIDYGLKYVSDENCIISTGESPRAYSLYSSGSLEAEDVDRLPSLLPCLSNREKLGEEKAVYFLSPRYRQNLCETFPVRAVFVPRVSGKRTTSILKRSPTQTLLALAPGSIFQLPGAGRDSFRAMADLVRQVPCYTLEVGTDLQEIPRVIEDFLRCGY